MRIVVVSDTYLPLLGGAEVHVAELVQRLRAEGHEVRLFTNQAGTTSDEAGITRMPWRRNFAEVFRNLDALCKQFNPDVIASHYSYRLAMLAGLVAKRRGIPMTVTLHGLGTLPEAHAAWGPRFRNWVYRRVSLACADRVIATSQDMLDAVPFVTRKTDIVTNAADGKVFDPERLQDDPEVAELRERYRGRPVILTVRRLNPKCGIQYLTEAMPEIVRRCPEALYVMIGTGRLESQIRERIVALGLDRHVVMTGPLPNRETAKYLSVADVVVFPSTAESTSIACIEAMLMGKAIVASRVGGLIELLGKEGERGRLVKLVDWESSNYEAPSVQDLPKSRIQALAGAIGDLLDSPTERDRLGAAGRSYATEHLEWDAVMRRTSRIYEKLATPLSRTPKAG